MAEQGEVKTASINGSAAAEADGKESQPYTVDGRKRYTTDNKVVHLSKEEEVNEKLTRIIGQKFAEYRKLWDAANAFQLETDFPLFLHIELAQVCNLRCPYCTHGDPIARAKYIKKARLDWPTYTRVILEGEEHGCPSMSPQGIDEPLLNKKLEEHILFAHKHGYMDIMMNTNATHLTEERSRKLLESGLTRLRFSLDAATPETYKKVRIGANFDNVHRNIDRFLEVKAKGGYQLPIVGVSFCRTKLNEHEVEAFVARWENAVDIVTVQEFIPPDTEADYSRFYPTNSRVRDDMMVGFKCVQPWQRVVIRNTGEVCPCCAMFSNDLSVGNVRDHTIHELWNSPAMKQLRGLHKAGNYWENPICLKCVNSILRKPGATEVFRLDPLGKGPGR
ncbi:MAG: SPASM domain-containing protein [Chloroflexi bacterium]|nr:SPASM domain-containing protein [Chloroflexota bacterium]